MSERKPGYYWIKLGDDWEPAEYDPSILKGKPWWISDDMCVAEHSIDEIGPYIPTPDEEEEQ